MVQLPLGQKLLMVYSWISMWLYFILICCLLRWRRKMAAFRSSYYQLFFLQAIADFYMFLTIEIVMRPRKYNFFNLFNEDMHTYAVFSYFNMITSQTVLCCGHLLISANRLTAFYKPLNHEEIWSRKQISVAVLSLWVLSIISAFPFIFIFPESIRFYLMREGRVQLFAGGYATLYDTIQSIVVNTTVVLFCSISYTYCFIMARKTVGRNANIEHNLLICAATSAFPFFFEFIRAIAGVFSSFNGISELYVWLTELWFYEIEIVASLPMWLQIIVNKILRECLIAEFSKLRKRPTPSTVVQPSSFETEVMAFPPTWLPVIVDSGLRVLICGFSGMRRKFYAIHSPTTFVTLFVVQFIAMRRS